MVTTWAAPRRLLGRCLTGVATAALVAGASLGTAPSAQAAGEQVTAVNSTLTITTAGWGHGRGMSQYGAQGAAKKGLTWSKILAFYYPGTKQVSLPSTNWMRVWITADTDNHLHVVPASGLRVRDTSRRTFTLPTGSKYVQWRISRSGSNRVLYYRDSKGVYRKYTNSKFKLDPRQVWYFENPKTNTVRLYLSSGSRTYRGSFAFRFYRTGARTVNHVKMEDYLRSVVPSEMPASWDPDAVAAQSVAARTYASRYRKNLGGKQIHDICDTTACQVYKGTSTEHPGSDQAIRTTAGKVLTHSGEYAWTEFSSSNGGYSVKGSYAYIKAQADPYDAAMNQVWSTSVKTSTIEKKYPSIGTLKSITLERDGKGRWGGRVTKVTLSGSKANQSVSGTSFKSALGLRETLMKISGGLATDTANYTRWQADYDGSKGALLGVPAASEQVKAGGLYAPFEAGALWWSTDTGSHRLSNLANRAYLTAGGPESSGLGFPTTDEAAITKPKAEGVETGTEVYFQTGLISCPTGATEAKACVVSVG